ncbi:FAD-dependent oxidoreductase, partial [Enterococcus hirae]
PQWYVIEGGSREYVRRLTRGHADRIRLNEAVTSVTRTPGGVQVTSAGGGAETYDFVFMACHSDQALDLLRDPTPDERDV